ncbi:MAG: thioesterase family protein [Lachnospiraceae bacterium]|nr:thioesterase family protein [Lachnospiraceae bacterium]
MLETGIKGQSEEMVTEGLTAEKMGSGLLPVYATPALIALVEKTAWESIASELEEGQGTVGTKLDIAHISATPVGMKVTCNTELKEIDRRRLVFSAEVFDEAGKIAEGTHERFIIENTKFQEKAYSKVKGPEK